VFATALHCFWEAPCSQLKVVFGFTANESGDAVTTLVPDKNVYQCTGEPIVGTAEGTDDWAVFRVDRPVLGRVPLFIRYTGTVGNDTSLIVAGHPHGLPLKITNPTNAVVKVNNTASNRFRSSLDTIAGFSGGPVVDQDTGVVEGIHVSGSVERDRQYVPHETGPNEYCAKERVCSESTGCDEFIVTSPWSGHTRATIPAEHVPLHPALTSLLVNG
jgi:hypothetical protein